MTNHAVNFKNVTLELGDGDQRIRALDNVSLTVEPGEFIGIVGPSGAGKSTLLAVMGALAAADSGTVEILGTDIAAMKGQQGKLAKFRLRNLGFVFQSGNLIPALNASEQLTLVHRMARLPGKFDPLPLLESVGMGAKAKHLPKQMSGGERQRVGIARALVTKPGLLLVDEPTAALDRNRSQHIAALLAEQCHERGVAGIMVTHDHDILHHCDRVFEMVDGHLAPYQVTAAA